MKKNKTKTYIINPKIEEYLRNLNPIQDNVLKEMEELGNERGFPIIGPLVGRLLYQLAIIIGAKRDIDMEYYPLVVDEGYKKLRRGGLFITDNVLWFGRVLTDDLSPSTKGVKEFTRLLFEEKGFVTTIIPIRDGISLSVKL